MRWIWAACAVIGLSACNGYKPLRYVPPPDPSAGAVYFAALGTLCDGRAFAGSLVSRDAADADFRDASIIMGPAQCSEAEIRIPLAVGEDRSRTWVITRTETGFVLKHDHRHKDGTLDAVTNYGGDSYGEGSAHRQEFPVDAETRDLFITEGIEVSVQNTWAVEIIPSETFVYEMWRPNRHFKLVFDLSESVPAPPPTWAEAPVE